MQTLKIKKEQGPIKNIGVGENVTIPLCLLFLALNLKNY
jgi:hypothetical protein